MPQSSIATDLDEATDVLLDLAPQVALDAVLALDNLS